MKVKLLVFTKVKNKGLKQLIAEYERRLVHHNVRFETLTFPESKQDKQQNRLKIYKTQHQHETIVLLDEFSTRMTTKDFSSFLKKRWIDGGVVTFILGDAHGFEESFKKEFEYRISLSPMTFPHEIAWLVWIEQVYRCVCIQSNITYHK
ncbi:MAG: 23S rRNA (pseudouridine(1915)-N(3))-methyltransferase RlmH [Nanoarchaeota archaeon]